MNNHICKYFEPIYSHSYELESFQPPLVVQAALYSRWGPGDGFAFQKKMHTSLNLITAGDARFSQNGRTGIVHTGELFLAHQGQSQQLSTGNAGYLHKRSLVIDGWMVTPLLERLGLTGVDVVRPANPVYVVNLLRRSLSCIKDKKDGFAQQTSLLLYEILMELGRSIAHEHPPSVLHAISFVQKNIAREITLEAIAASVNLSVRQCCRLFQASMGCSLMQFVIGQRLAIARDLLANSSLSIKEIAGRVGYGDPFHFSIQFKRRFGASPKLFRESSPDR